jgi:hypothetical protein
VKEHRKAFFEQWEQEAIALAPQENIAGAFLHEDVKNLPRRKGPS